MTLELYAIPVPGPGRLSTMPRPDGGDRLTAEMVALRAAGVDVLVSLQTDQERREIGLVDEAVAAAGAGLRFHGFPIADFGVPVRAEIDPLLDALLADIRAGRHVAVHCWAGIGRSSLVAAALLVRLGTPADDAWSIISAARGHQVPETDSQRTWLVDNPVAE